MYTRQSASIPLSDTRPMSSSHALITSSMSQFHMQPALLLHGCRCRSHTRTYTHAQPHPLIHIWHQWMAQVEGGANSHRSDPPAIPLYTISQYTIITLPTVNIWAKHWNGHPSDHCSRGNWEWVLLKHYQWLNVKNWCPLLPLATSTWKHQWNGVMQVPLFISIRFCWNVLR